MRQVAGTLDHASSASGLRAGVQARRAGHVPAGIMCMCTTRVVPDRGLGLPYSCGYAPMNGGQEPQCGAPTKHTTSPAAPIAQSRW